MSKPMWELYPHIWKTQSAFFSFIRGGIRKGLWSTNPVKLEFIKANRVKVPLGRKTKSNPEGLVWGAECKLCNNPFRLNDIQVDHIEGNHSLKSVDDLKEFIENIVFVDDSKLQLVCKGCHKTKTHSEKKGITFEQAKTEKQAIEKSKQSVSIQKEELIKLGFKESEITNAKKRRECYTRYFNNKEE